MKINNIIKFLLLTLPLILLVTCTNTQNDHVKNKPALIIQKKVDSLLAMMTIREKIGQMNQYSVGSELTGPGKKEGRTKNRYDKLVNGEIGSVLNLLGVEETCKLQQIAVEKTRLGIPLIFAYDVIHGYKTIFPIPLAEAASWDLNAIEKSARIAAKETASAGIQWTFAPMIDISRDARWGRVMEGAGEDTYLNGVIAEARIKGFQGNDLKNPTTIAACAKHFAAYGFVESGKDYNAVNLGRNVLHNVILPPFKQSVTTGVATFMNAFNDIDGVPSTSNLYLQRTLLKGKWNFNGVVVSDWGSIRELLNHRVAKDVASAAQLAITGGCDIDMESDAYINALEKLVKNGKISESLIDDAVKRILTLKFKLGLFDDPYKYCDAEREKQTLLHPDHLKFSREIAAKSIVLLKNDTKRLLPLKNDKKIAIIGPLAKDKDSPIGNWRAQGGTNSAVSFYEAMIKKYGENISYAEGCNLSIGENNFFNEVTIEEKNKSGFTKARQIAKNADIVIMVLGEPAFMSGEAKSRSEIGLPGLQLELLKSVHQVNKNIVLVLMNGRPLTIPWESENISAIVEAWYLGSESGNAIVDVLSGKVNPSGKLPMSFPRTVGQVPIYYNYLNTGRPESDLIFYQHHMDVERTPLFPFGFGLSYTKFDFSDYQLTVNEDKVNVSLNITNSGNYEGTEVVQLYISDLVASISRPVLELKKFERITLKKGKRKKINFILTKQDLSFYNSEGDLTFEPGDFEISVGANSQNLITEKMSMN